MEQYCMYLRKSRADREAEQRGEMETLSRHEAALLALAARNHHPITKIYREVVSGETIAARPCMQELLSEVEAGIWTGVYVMEIERLARGDTIDQGVVSRAFRLSSTLIITPIKTYHPDNEFDEEYFEFGLFMSRREYATIKRRLQRGREASVREGKYIGNRTPYGYYREKIPHDKGFRLVPDPDQADVVRNIYKWYCNGIPADGVSPTTFGMAKIRDRLNGLGIPAATGGPWTISSISGILQNPVYTGKIRHNYRPAEKSLSGGVITVRRPRNGSGDLYDGLHEAIISQESFDMVQDFMKNRKLPSIPYKKKMANPLSGIVHCSVCGKVMIRRPYQSGRQCTLMCQTAHCATVASDLDDVEKEILNGLAEWLKDYKLQWNIPDSADSSPAVSMLQTQLVQKRKEEERLQSQLDNTYDLLEQGIYTKDVFLTRNKMVVEKLEEVHISIDSLEKEIVLEQKRLQAKIDVIPKVENILDVYWTLPDAKSKNDLLKSVLDKVIYTKSGRNGPHRKVHYTFALDLYPRLPKSP